MRLKSIRWRLPIHFLGVVGLTVLLLGAVLFILLQAYYRGLEQSYLRGASQAIPNNILEILKSEDSQAELQAYFENVAFLSQTRIRVIDVEGEILVDTGSPSDYNIDLGIRTEPVEFLVPGERRIIEPYIVIREGVYGQDRLPQDIPPSQSSDSRITGSPEGILPTSEVELTGDEEDIIAVIVTPIPPSDYDRKTVINEVSMFATNLGIGFDGEEASLEKRSSENLQIEIHETTGLLGYIEFSEGPAYGRKILSSVAIGFLIAGTLAMSLGAFAGWLVSRRFSSPLLSLAESTASMAEGEYSTRVDVEREDEFGKLAASFNRMAEQVEGTIDTLQRFISDAAHELNTPITALRTNLELIADEKNNDIQKSYVDRALMQTYRLEESTQALLDLSQLESGASKEDIAQINLASLIRDESERYASIAEQEGIEFSLDLPEEEILMMGRSNQIRRAVSNLLDNAIKFTPQGGNVTLGLKPEGDSIHLWVEDTGIGIPEEDMPHLFQRFHRAPNASIYQGSGLGLAIVKTIIEGHGGRIQAESEGQGSRFTIHLPASH